jgi:hypothetical protein
MGTPPNPPLEDRLLCPDISGTPRAPAGVLTYKSTFRASRRSRGSVSEHTSRSSPASPEWGFVVQGCADWRAVVAEGTACHRDFVLAGGLWLAPRLPLWASLGFQVSFGVGCGLLFAWFLSLIERCAADLLLWVSM